MKSVLDSLEMLGCQRWDRLVSGSTSCLKTEQNKNLKYFVTCTTYHVSWIISERCIFSEMVTKRKPIGFPVCKMCSCLI